MKKSILAVVLMLCMMCSTAAAAMEVPTDTIVQNLNGQQQMVKVYTLSPEQDAQALVEAPFEYDGYTYTFAGIVKENIPYYEEKSVTQTITIETDSSELAAVLEKLSPTMDYAKDGYTGTLTLDHTSIKTEASGYTTKSYTVTETKEIGGLDRNDPAYVPATTVKNGQTLSLTNVEWVVQGTSLVGDSLIPSSYMAVATYSAKNYRNVATGYVTTADYTGTVKSSGISGVVYTLTYLGEKIVELPIDPGSSIVPLLPAAIGVFGLLLLLCVFWLLRRNNVVIYEPDDERDEYRKIGAMRITKQHPAIDLTRLRHYPAGEVGIEIKRRAARKLLGRHIPILFRGFKAFYYIENADNDCWATFSAQGIPEEDTEEETAI